MLLGRVDIRSPKIEISATDSRLPEILRELRPTRVELKTNRVLLVMEDRRYGVVWAEDEYQPKMWRLTIHSEAGPLNVLSISK